MSVLLECLSGDPIYCVSEFHTRPLGVPFSKSESRVIKIGERVTYRRSEEDMHFKDHPNRWQVVYETADGAQHQAVAFLFVTEEVWQGIEQFFSDRLRNCMDANTAAAEPLASTTA